MSDIGPQEVVDAVERIHAEPDDDKARKMEEELLEETSKGGADHVPEEES